MKDRKVIYQDTRGDLTEWDCGCVVYYEEDKTSVHICDHERCPVLSNLWNGQDPIVVQNRMARTFTWR